MHIQKRLWGIFTVILAVLTGQKGPQIQHWGTKYSFVVHISERSQFESKNLEMAKSKHKAHFSMDLMRTEVTNRREEPKPSVHEIVVL